MSTASARPVRLGPRSVTALVLVSLIGLFAFCWPLFADSRLRRHVARR